jgi:hypothetical protein
MGQKLLKQLEGERCMAESPWTQIDEMENLILDRFKRIDRPVNGLFGRKQKGSG